MDDELEKLGKDFVSTLRNIPLDELSISDYNKKYIRRMLPKMEYYADIYLNVIDFYCLTVDGFPYDHPVVDYGGGHGFLSILLKTLGAKHVIYVDNNPQSVAAAKAIKDHVGKGADVFICGEEEDLIEWCQNNEVKPSLLMGFDVIEHIYDLDKYFDNLFTAFPDMNHSYTTASVEKNIFKTRKLKKQMYLDEYGTDTKQGYFDIRKQFIKNEFPALTDEEAHLWAADTRGMNYKDILLTVSLKMDVTPKDDYNTCNPETGSWTERILTEKEYRDLISRHGGGLFILPGKYNKSHKGIKKIVAKILNRLMRKEYFRQRLQPFIFLYIQGPNNHKKAMERLLECILSGSYYLEDYE